MPSSKSRSLKESGKRSFTINNAYHVDGCPTKFSHKDYTGRYIKNSPQRAALNALSELCRVKRIRGQCTLYIEMRETTQGSSGKLYAYHCKRIHLKKPIELNGRVIHYFNKAKPVIIPTEKCKKSHKSSGRMISRSSKLRSQHSNKHTHSHKSGSHKSKSKSMTKKISNTMKHTFASVKKSVKSML
jgi:hypothetical protein